MNINNIPTELSGNFQLSNNKSDSTYSGPHSALLHLIKQRIINVEKSLPPGTQVLIVAICPNVHHANTIYIPEVFGGFFFNHFIEPFLDRQEYGY